MKSFLMAFVMLASSTVFAMADGQYDCKITEQGGDKSVVQMSFTMKDGDIACKVDDGGEWCIEWFAYAPVEQAKFWLDGLYDGGFGFGDKGDFEVDADADGCNIGKLKLYKNSGFTKGFITTEFRCSGSENQRYAGKVSCDIK